MGWDSAQFASRSVPDHDAARTARLSKLLSSVAGSSGSPALLMIVAGALASYVLTLLVLALIA
jgi:hypothetical protein